MAARQCRRHLEHVAGLRPLRPGLASNPAAWIPRHEGAPRAVRRQGRFVLRFVRNRDGCDARRYRPLHCAGEKEPRREPRVGASRQRGGQPGAAEGGRARDGLRRDDVRVAVLLLQRTPRRHTVPFAHGARRVPHAVLRCRHCRRSHKRGGVPRTAQALPVAVGFDFQLLEPACRLRWHQCRRHERLQPRLAHHSRRHGRMRAGDAEVPCKGCDQHPRLGVGQDARHGASPPLDFLHRRRADGAGAEEVVRRERRGLPHDGRKGMLRVHTARRRERHRRRSRQFPEANREDAGRGKSRRGGLAGLRVVPLRVPTASRRCRGQMPRNRLRVREGAGRCEPRELHDACNGARAPDAARRLRERMSTRQLQPHTRRRIGNGSRCATCNQGNRIRTPRNDTLRARRRDGWELERTRYAAPENAALATQVGQQQFRGECAGSRSDRPLRRPDKRQAERSRRHLPR